MQEIEENDMGGNVADDGIIEGEGSTPSGRAPRTFEVELRGGYLLDRCIPGDVIEVIGVLKSLQTEVGYRRGRQGGAVESGLHQLYVLANSLVIFSQQDSRRKRLHSDGANCNYDTKRSRKADATGESNEATSSAQMPSKALDVTSFSNESLSILQSIALHEHCLGVLVNALCPLIFGHELVKLGLLLGLMGAPSDSEVTKAISQMQTFEADTSFPSSSVYSDSSKSKSHSIADVANEDGSGNVRTRNNIHVLVVGDPGLGKSQMLRAASKVAPRAVRFLFDCVLMISIDDVFMCSLTRYL